MTIRRLSALGRHLAPTPAAAAYSTTRDPLTNNTVGVVAKDATRASPGYTLFSNGCARQSACSRPCTRRAACSIAMRAQA